MSMRRSAMFHQSKYTCIFSTFKCFKSHHNGYHHPILHIFSPINLQIHPHPPPPRNMRLHQVHFSQINSRRRRLPRYSAPPSTTTTQTHHLSGNQQRRRCQEIHHRTTRRQIHVLERHPISRFPLRSYRHGTVDIGIKCGG